MLIWISILRPLWMWGKIPQRIPTFLPAWKASMLNQSKIYAQPTSFFNLSSTICEVFLSVKYLVWSLGDLTKQAAKKLQLIWLSKRSTWKRGSRGYCRWFFVCCLQRWLADLELSDGYTVSFDLKSWGHRKSGHSQNCNLEYRSKLNAAILL